MDSPGAGLLADDRLHWKEYRLGDLWRYRIGDYKVICEIRDAALRILVVRASHQREAYR